MAKKNILIMDDSSTMRKIISRSLRQTGLHLGEIYEATDGIEGLDVLRKQSVDLVLSDINMPNMDGLEFIEASRGAGHKMPIIMLTTESGESVIAEAINKGANGHIKKPFTPDTLAESLRGYL